ncbi:conserved hypothetical protein [Chromohalobacter israelensis DSM 3043]|uniref:Monooxygenase n=1 Tax=Chromohalobacter israelensis (strain ATCC BAA-138 / DSM 3043 / CIP 106854 / NCIMB 13768 / 1H11) TaxID=290398 RepID=Q1QTF9_CHRI1|nr:conserved hypothetical protein [Chromohalobacter salexigens DSM 3043]
MIIAITKFRLPKPVSREEAREIFLSTAPKYQGASGLLRKHYVMWEDGSTVGGVYLWNSCSEAEAMYTESWKAFVRGKYGTEPSVTYLDNPITVDNISEEILSNG